MGRELSERNIQEQLAHHQLGAQGERNEAQVLGSSDWVNMRRVVEIGNKSGASCTIRTFIEHCSEYFIHAIHCCICHQERKIATRETTPRHAL